MMLQTVGYLFKFFKGWGIRISLIHDAEFRMFEIVLVLV